MTHNSSNKFKIGVFDSGLGGLTVLKSLSQLSPGNEYLYLGDSARVPYGNKSASTIKKYVKQCIQFFLEKKVDAIVVACNSASSVIENKSSYAVPIFDVIQPSAQLATNLAFNERIAVIATRTTVNQKSYVKAIQKLNPHISVFQQACPLLVPIVEEGLIDDPLTNLILYRYLNPLMQTSPDCIILGCTHYPLLLPAIKKVVGRHTPIISSAEAVAESFCKSYPFIDPSVSGNLKDRLSVNSLTRGSAKSDLSLGNPAAGTTAIPKAIHSTIQDSNQTSDLTADSTSDKPSDLTSGLKENLDIKIFMTDESTSLERIFKHLFPNQTLPNIKIVEL